MAVTFAVASGGGTVSPTTAVLTNASGIAAVTSWTLGTTPGSNTLTATADALTGSPVTFTATGTVGAATKLAITTPPSSTVQSGIAFPQRSEERRVGEDSSPGSQSGTLMSTDIAPGRRTMGRSETVTPTAGGTDVL